MLQESPELLGGTRLALRKSTPQNHAFLLPLPTLGGDPPTLVMYSSVTVPPGFSHGPEAYPRVCFAAAL